MAIYWYSAGVDAFLLDCPRCCNSYGYDTEEKAKAAVGLHISCIRQYIPQYT